MKASYLWLGSVNAALAVVAPACGSSDFGGGGFSKMDSSANGGAANSADAARSEAGSSTGGALSDGGGQPGPDGSSSDGSSARDSGGVGTGGTRTGTGGRVGSGGMAGAGGAAGVGGTVGSGSAGGCASPMTFFPDQDKDQYGRSTGTVSACTAPSTGSWATVGGDCNDDNALVHPNQQSYFDVPFSTSGGKDSFDYDCSAHEDGDSTQPGAAPTCSSLLGIGCAGTGFANTSRSGSGVNPLCGSKTQVTCTPAALACNAVVKTVSDGYRCK